VAGEKLSSQALKIVKSSKLSIYL